MGSDDESARTVADTPSLASGWPRPPAPRPPPPPAEPARKPKGKPDPMVGTTLDGRFTIKRLIARGGMGRVYEAVQQPLGRRIALKVLHLRYSEDLDPDFRKRFFLKPSPEREARKR